MESGPPDVQPLREALEREPALRRLMFDTAGLTAWSSGLIVFFLQCRELCRTLNLVSDHASLQAEAPRLIEQAARLAAPGN